MDDKKFKRKIEDFVCESCGYEVEGNGYTNHCPNCLWSKHVDVNPGDRKETCHGMMKPVDLENKGNVFYVVHECLMCKFKKRNKVVKGDNFSQLIKISQDGEL